LVFNVLDGGGGERDSGDELQEVLVAEERRLLALVVSIDGHRAVSKLWAVRGDKKR
jgi:hypothetical protein